MIVLCPTHGAAYRRAPALYPEKNAQGPLSYCTTLLLSFIIKGSAYFIVTHAYQRISVLTGDLHRAQSSPPVKHGAALGAHGHGPPPTQPMHTPTGMLSRACKMKIRGWLTSGYPLTLLNAWCSTIPAQHTAPITPTRPTWCSTMPSLPLKPTRTYSRATGATRTNCETGEKL